MLVLRFLSAKGAFLALFLLLAGASTAGSQVTFSTEPLTITSPGGKVHRFIVELALDGDQRQQGLMFRREMDDDRGMLFDFGRARGVTMWMKNTYIPLDMLFINRSGVVRTIRENAVPQSEAIIDSREAVLYVLELNGGTVGKLGLKPGDRVDSARIAQQRGIVEE